MKFGGWQLKSKQYEKERNDQGRLAPPVCLMRARTTMD